MRIGIDLDGVVYDFVDAFRRHLVDTWWSTPLDLPEPTQWEMWEAWGMDQGDWMNEFSAGVKSGEIFGAGEPYPGSVDSLNRLWRTGHQIHIVTHRNVHSDAIGLTAEWLAEWEIPYSSLTFAADKTVVPTDIFIEDNVDNAIALAGVGTRAVLMDRPWNRDAPGIKRVESWEEFERVVGEHR